MYLHEFERLKLHEKKANVDHPKMTELEKLDYRVLRLEDLQNRINSLSQAITSGKIKSKENIEHAKRILVELGKRYKELLDNKVSSIDHRTRMLEIAEEHKYSQIIKSIKYFDKTILDSETINNPNLLLYKLGDLISKYSQKELNKIIIFEGYENNTKEAIFDLLKRFTNSPVYFDLAYNNIIKFKDKRTLDLLIKDLQIKPQQHKYSITNNIIDFLRNNPKYKSYAVTELQKLIHTKEDFLKTQISRILLRIESLESIKLGLDLVSKITDLNDFEDSFMIYLHSTNYLNNPEILTSYAKIIKRFLKNNSKLPETFFERVVPNIKDIKTFVKMFSPEELKKMLQSKKNAAYSTFYELGYDYLKAAINNTLKEIRINNETISYFVVNDLNVISTFNGFAYAIDIKVPERFRHLLIWHEYIESKTHSHSNAIVEEIKLAKSTGLLDEFLKYLKGVLTPKEFNKRKKASEIYA